MQEVQAVRGQFQGDVQPRGYLAVQQPQLTLHNKFGDRVALESRAIHPGDWDNRPQREVSRHVGADQEVHYQNEVGGREERGAAVAGQ